MSELVVSEVRGHVLLIGVDRQDKRNAWNREVIREVAEAYTRLDKDPELRVGVIYGEGDHFTAGLDLMDVLPSVAGNDVGEILPSELCDPWDFLGRPCSKPVVVAVQGRCYTLGIELILASQVAVAASDTVFAQLEVARGIVPLGGGSHRLPSLGAKGKYWLLSAAEFSANEALEVGMVTEVVEPGQQLDRAIELAEQIATNAPHAVQSALAASRAAVSEQRDAAANYLRSETVSLVTSEDALEGMNAMIERRPAAFKGR